jgi:hypothetical protein
MADDDPGMETLPTRAEGNFPQRQLRQNPTTDKRNITTKDGDVVKAVLFDTCATTDPTSSGGTPACWILELTPEQKALNPCGSECEKPPQLKG